MSDFPEIEKKVIPPRDELISLKEYAVKNSISYETARRTVQNHVDDIDLVNHIYVIDRVRFLDKEGENALDKIRANKQTATVVVHEKTEEFKELEKEVKEKDQIIDSLRQEISKHRNEKEELMKQLIDFKNDPSLALDTSKYILLEDHKKVEEELKKKDEEIETLSSEITDLKGENESLQKDSRELKEMTLKNVSLIKKNEETLKEIEEKRQEIRNFEEKTDEMKRKISDVEIERDKANLEKEKVLADAELERKRMEQEYEEALKLGFFARRRKLKELMKKKEEK